LSRQTHGFYTFLYQTSGFLHLLCSVEEKEHHVLFLSLSLLPSWIEEANLVTKGEERFTTVFIEVIINSYASPVFFSPRTKTITIEKEKDLHASSSSSSFFI
jgi:hypothetical protein